MGMLNILVGAKEAIKKGKIVANPARAKNQQAFATATVGLGVFLYEVYQTVCPILISSCPDVGVDKVTTIGTAFAVLLYTGHNIWATYATSTKVGIGEHPDDGLRELSGPTPDGQVPPVNSGDTEHAEEVVQNQFLDGS